MFSSSKTVFDVLSGQVSLGKPAQYAKLAEKEGLTVVTVVPGIAGHTTVDAELFTDKTGAVIVDKAAALSAGKKFINTLPRKGFAGIALLFWNGEYRNSIPFGIDVFETARLAAETETYKATAKRIDGIALDTDKAYQAVHTAETMQKKATATANNREKELLKQCENEELARKVNAQKAITQATAPQPVKPAATVKTAKTVKPAAKLVQIAGEQVKAETNGASSHTATATA